MYLTYGSKTAEVLISTNGRSPVEVVKKSFKSKGTFDEFEYDNKVLEEAKGFYVEEKLPTQETEPKNKSLEQGLQKA
ncbi:17583_t:CDS:2 [Gigaspora margarita]|uniref:17583_t:CDS:1 n=1 Tax=Gigaspora margarita TaxID=4874 RepID=A0ABN7V6T0_GIGMA|nr:17583_t:CDS:2 [Gigaspora margarita]